MALYQSGAVIFQQTDRLAVAMILWGHMAPWNTLFGCHY